ncbi:hypothetical protein GAPWKB11_1119 [Gilliamella apicola]|nr:hypothetical protein GAPWKB11_1119 [Gilliamella apicola]
MLMKNRFQIKRLCQRINEIMFYAVNIGLIDANLVTKIKNAFKKR